jgi:hypothetical protein
MEAVMAKKPELIIALGVAILVIAGLMWFNINPIWTNLFPGIRQISAQIYPTDQSEPVEKIDTETGKGSSYAVPLQAVFRWVYIVVGAGLTAFALFVILIDYVVERWNIKISFGIPRILHRH